VFALVHAAAASPHGLAPRNIALVQLMLQAGLRVGEVTALTQVDVDLKARSGIVHVRDGKGRKARRWLHILSVAVVMAVSLYVILDVEFPRLVFIQVDAFDQALVELRESMQ
jgi:site-specific recombinase XerC